MSNNMKVTHAQEDEAKLARTTTVEATLESKLKQALDLDFAHMLQTPSGVAKFRGMNKKNDDDDDDDDDERDDFADDASVLTKGTVATTATASSAMLKPTFIQVPKVDPKTLPSRKRENMEKERKAPELQSIEINQEEHLSNVAAAAKQEEKDRRLRAAREAEEKKVTMEAEEEAANGDQQEVLSSEEEAANGDQQEVLSTEEEGHEVAA